MGAMACHKLVHACTPTVPHVMKDVVLSHKLPVDAVNEDLSILRHTDESLLGVPAHTNNVGGTGPLQGRGRGGEGEGRGGALREGVGQGYCDNQKGGCGEMRSRRSNSRCSGCLSQTRLRVHPNTPHRVRPYRLIETHTAHY